MFTLLYFLAVNFPAANWKLSLIHSGIVISFSLSIIVLVFTPLVFQGVSMQNGTIVPIPNFGLSLYGLNILGLPLLSSMVLIRKFSSSKGKEREQLKFLSLGIIITLILTIITNFLLVNIFNFTDLVVLGPFFTLIFVAFSTYAILRHQLMDIRIILTETLVFFIAFVLLVDVFVSQNIYERFLRTGMFLIFSFFAYLLVKSVLNEIKRREELEILTLELKKTNLEVERLSRIKTEFLSIASHQLRTPLAAIKGYVSLVLEGIYGNLNAKTKEILDRVYKSNERLIRLINDLLNISRIESGKIELTIEELQLEDIVSDIIKELEVGAKEKNIYLEWRKPQIPLPKIRNDKEKIREVISNIVDNAIKYTENGGVEITCEIRDFCLRLKVKDTGAGMTQEELGSIFKSFSRGKAGTKFWTEGTGLGLYVARKFVEMQKGRVWAESDGKNKGSTFYIELPTM